jgi:hypothetical protein
VRRGGDHVGGGVPRWCDRRRLSYHRLRHSCGTGEVPGKVFGGKAHRPGARGVWWWSGGGVAMFQGGGGGRVLFDAAFELRGALLQLRVGVDKVGRSQGGCP